MTLPTKFKGYDTYNDQTGQTRFTIHNDGSVVLPSEVFNSFGQQLSFSTAADVKNYGGKGDGIANETDAIHRAIASSNNVYLPEGEYLIDPLTLKPGLTLFGDGPGRTILKWRDPAVTGSMILMQDMADITISGMELDGRCDPADYDATGAVGINAGSGTGGSTASANITLQNLYIHDMSKQGVLDFSGGENWEVFKCRFERCGRAGLVSSGLRSSRIGFCHFVDTGDDGLAVNNNSTDTTVIGNTFQRCGSLIGLTAAGLKLHGQHNTITANTFRDCYNSISIKGHATHGNATEVAAYGAAMHNTITGNVIHHVATYTGGGTPNGIEIASAYGVLIENNVIIATQSNGQPRDIITIEQGGAVVIRNNYMVGQTIRFASTYAREVLLQDNIIHTFVYDGDSYNDYYVLEFVSGATVEKVRFINNGVDEVAAVIAKGFGDVHIGELEIDGTYEILNKPIGHLDVDITSGATTTQIELNGNIPTQSGLMYKLAADAELWICTVEPTGLVQREKIVLSAEADSQSSNISIDSWTPSRDYQKERSWLANKRPDTITQPTRKAYWFGSGADHIIDLLHIGKNAIDTAGNQYGGSTINGYRLLRGSTAVRPAGLFARETFEYFDTDLGKPIYWTGSGWVDAAGASV